MKTTLFLLLLTIFAINCKKDNSKPAQANNIIIKTAPTKVDYFNGDALDLAGLVVTLQFDNGSSEDISFSDFENYGITTVPSNGSVLTESVTLQIQHTSSNKTTSQDITVSEIAVTGISVKTPPAKVNYYIDENINLSGLVATLTMNNGNTKDVAFPNFDSNDISCSPENGAKANEANKIVTITHTLSGKSISFDIVIDKFKDTRDGQVYKFVKIGNQVWMAENLRYLPSVVGPAIASSTSPYYYVYGYNDTNVSEAKATANYTSYGVLYNWPAAMNGAESSTAKPIGVQGICPDGWHLPSDAEWTQLIYYLGGEIISGSKLKETGTTHWNSPNTGATNETGFTALPGGFRHVNGTIRSMGYDGFWWSTTKYDSSSVLFRYMEYSNTFIGWGSNTKEIGYSVRCVKD
jgi:uncharacterized protein (TIGR02145 family)